MNSTDIIVDMTRGNRQRIRREKTLESLEREVEEFKTMLVETVDEHKDSGI